MDRRNGADARGRCQRAVIDNGVRERITRTARGAKGKRQATVKEEIDDEAGDEAVAADNPEGADGDGDDTVIARKPGDDREGGTDAGTDAEEESKGE